MKRISFLLSDLVCSECGHVFTIPRRRSRTKPPGHIKSMWCPMCLAERDFIEQTKYGVIQAQEVDQCMMQT